MTPTPKTAYGGSTIDCQQAIAPAYRHIVTEAENAGWSKAEVAVALRELAEAHVMDLVAQGDDMERQVLVALRS